MGRGASPVETGFDTKYSHFIEKKRCDFVQIALIYCEFVNSIENSCDLC